MGIRGQPHPSASLTPGKRPGTHYTGGWVGPMVGLEACENSRPNRLSITGTYSPWRASIPNTLFRPTSREDMHLFLLEILGPQGDRY